jgi:hypothetical protein
MITVALSIVSVVVIGYAALAAFGALGMLFAGACRLVTKAANRLA